MTKICSRCNIEKPVEKFKKNRNICHACDYKAKKERYHLGGPTATAQRRASVRWNHNLRERAIKALGKKCRCGQSDPRALFIVPLVNRDEYWKKSPSVRYRFVAEHRRQFQLACANCNWISRHENNRLGGKPRQY